MLSIVPFPVKLGSIECSETQKLTQWSLIDHISTLVVYDAQIYRYKVLKHGLRRDQFSLEIGLAKFDLVNGKAYKAVLIGLI